MIEIIPAIDLIEGKCVRLSQGDFGRQKIYRENPLDVAKEFESVGLRRLHVVDLDGAKTGKLTNLKVLETLAGHTGLVIDFGGGIKTNADVQSVFDAGAHFASIGSVAVRDPETFYSWIEKYGSDRILLGADVRAGRISINGWQTETELEIISFLKAYVRRGVGQVFCTDISKDGLLQGVATALYEQILDSFPDLKLIASGGVSRIEDIYQLDRIGCSGVIVGKAIYEGRIRLEELQF